MLSNQTIGSTMDSTQVTPYVLLTLRAFGRVLEIPSNVHHTFRAFNIKESAYGGLVFTYTFSTVDMEMLEQLMQMRMQGYGVLKWGYFQGSTLYETEPRRVAIGEVSIDGEHYNEVVVTINGLCYGMFSMMACRQKVYNGKTPSQIVAEIAKLNDLEGNPASETKRFQRNEIVATTRKRHLFQTVHSDWEFLQREVMPNVYSKAGSDLYLFVRHGYSLNLVAPDTEARQDVDVYFSSNYMGVRNEIISYNLTTSELNNRNGGAGRTKMLGWNPRTKRPIEIEMTEENSEFIYLSGGGYPVQKHMSPSYVTLIEHCLYPEDEDYDVEDVERVGVRKWNQAARCLFEVQLHMLPTNTVNVGDIIRVNVHDSSEHSQFLNGNYFVTAMNNTMVPSSMGTSVRAIRRGFSQHSVK